MNHEIYETHEKILFKEECFATQGAVFETFLKLGLIINFGHYPKAQIERIIL